MKQKNNISQLIILGILVFAIVAFAAFRLFAPSMATRANSTPSPKRIEENVPQGSPAMLTLYDAPKTITASTDATMTVEGQPVFVYDAVVNNTHAWSKTPKLSSTPMAYFDFEGEVIVDILMTGLANPIKSAVVSPVSAGVQAEVKDRHVRFTLSKPGQYTVQFNESANKAMHIFANPLEKDIPDKNDPNVIFIEPGDWEIESLVLKDNQTLYLAGGAILRGSVIADNAKNVSIRGRGMIDGSLHESWVSQGEYARVPIDFRNSRNIKVEGIIIHNSNAWCFNSYQSDGAEISNVKIISARPNGDGFTFQSCLNYNVKDCFVRSWDDSLVVKNYGTNSDKITFDNVQIWTDLAQSCEIGYETNKGKTNDSKITNITFKNITVLYNFHKPVLSIHNSDDALIQNVTYSNIVVENALMGKGDAGDNNQLIDFYIAASGWSSTANRGKIKDVLVENLNVLKSDSGVTPPSRIYGYDEEHMIENVAIKNVVINGKKITDQKDLKVKINAYTANISVVSLNTSSQTPATPDPVATGNNYTKPAPVVKHVTTPDQSKAEVPAGFKKAEPVIPKLPSGENLALNKPVESGLHTDVYVTKNVNDGKVLTYWEGAAFPNTMKIDLSGTYKVKTAVVMLNPAAIWGPRTQTFEIQVSTDGKNFTTAVPSTQYQFDPQTGNLVIIDFAAIDAAYVQFVFTQNSGTFEKGAQAAEICIYE